MSVPISTIRRWSTLTAALLLVSGALAACGGGGSDDDSSSTSGGSTKVSAVESGGLSFSESELTAKAGKVTLELDNPRDNKMPHAIEIEGNGIEQETPTAEPGGGASVTVDLKPGTYTFYCPVGQHRQAGMEGTLTVS